MAIQDRKLENQGWSRRSKVIAVVLAGALALAIVVTAEITAGGGLWRLALSAQLQTDKRCRLDKVIDYKEFRIGDQLVREGRIRCLDAREFNFSQKKSHLKFELRLCQPARC